MYQEEEKRVPRRLVGGGAQTVLEPHLSLTAESAAQTLGTPGNVLQAPSYSGAAVAHNTSHRIR